MEKQKENFTKELDFVCAGVVCYTFLLLYYLSIIPTASTTGDSIENKSTTPEKVVVVATNVNWRNYLKYPEEAKLSAEAKDLISRLLCNVEHRLRTRGAGVICNVKIVVHSVYLPFPHINHVAAVITILGGEGQGASEGATTISDAAGLVSDETCSALDGRGGCVAGFTTAGMFPMPQVEPMVEIEDHHAC
ncbi:unnamed protein product [Vicia faba]|uniref:Uncharacterized protein n=1 Tax=Vicia faba TaxID=3906 RepID=A0AAV0ZQG0_VICFA|nr:unnamed protein product [Vicia faba]